MRLIIFVIAYCGVGPAIAAPYVAGYERFHSGAVLYSELGCAKCHGGSEVEIPRSGPLLSNLANRVEYNWVVAFLKDPQAAHKGSTMPKMTHGLSDREITSIAAYLGTIQHGKPLKVSRHVNAERGSAAYHEKGCIACHAPTDDYRGPHGSGAAVRPEMVVEFPDLKNKYTLTTLDNFLLQTSKYRPDGRMPHIELSKENSLDIAAHLLDFQGSDPRELPGLKAWPKSDVTEINEGKALVVRLNCAACHTIPGVKKPVLIPLKNVADHCLSKSPSAGLPYYHFTGEQRKSLKEYIKAPPEDENSTLQALNCYACHDRDGVGGPTIKTNPFFTGNEGLGDSGRLPPPLTGIGHKLQPEWLEGVLSGKPETRVRPYLKTQMPKYPANAKKMAAWLTKLDAKPDATPLSIVPNSHDAGRKLLGIQGGVNCITCHNWADKKSPGIPGPDISSLDKRLRPEWFREYLLNPASYRPATLMPPLWPGGHSAVPDVLGGDTEKQIAAIWEFIKNGEGIPEGFPDQTSGDFELIPDDRPVIQRTFLEKTGSKAILVGFPGDIHIAFDGLKGKPSLVWRGKFFNAYNTWFTRAAPFENPLSKEVYEFAPSGESMRFRGYEIDEAGNPAFLLSKDGFDVVEHFEVKDGKLIRTVTGESIPSLTHPTGLEVDKLVTSEEQIYTYYWK